MLTYLRVSNIALIDEIEAEFGAGLNLLTGETGSGKSIIVDSLGALTGDRVSSDLIRSGEETAHIEGIFVLPRNLGLEKICDESGINIDDGEEISFIVRRQISAKGKNRIFVNGQLVTNAFLKELGSQLVDIYGQGEHATLFDAAAHREMFDEYAGLADARRRTTVAYREWSDVRAELEGLEIDQSEKLQLIDILRFQVDEAKKAELSAGEDVQLEEEKRRLNNIEKLSALSDDVYDLIYDSATSTLATLEKAARKLKELSEFESKFGEYEEAIASALATIEDAAFSTRDFRGRLEFSPERLEQIENRLAEISRLTRKYGGSIESVLEHIRHSEERLESIETSEFREKELRKKLADARTNYIETAVELNASRKAAASRFEKAVESDLKTVALEKARFEVRIDGPVTRDAAAEYADQAFSPNGIGKLEFYFSANAGEEPKPLTKVASGGEASRLMLILKTVSRSKGREKTAVFDEVDAGIGGRVAEAVGSKLKDLARSFQVLCVTHQPQVASKADRHFIVEKKIKSGQTTISLRELSAAEQIEEVARMLAGEKITDAARANAREMIAASA